MAIIAGGDSADAASTSASTITDEEVVDNFIHDASARYA